MLTQFKFSVMHTIQISVQDSVYSHFINFLGTFKNNEIKVLSDEKLRLQDPVFLKNQKELQDTLARIEAGEATLITMEELEATLDKTIAKYENKN